jgi:uncharacterized protein
VHRGRLDLEAKCRSGAGCAGELDIAIDRSGLGRICTTSGYSPAHAASSASTYRVEQEVAHMQLFTVPLEKPDDVNLILGQSHFIKTVEDLHEVLAGASPHLKFGVAFCESSGPRLVRRSGNDGDLVELATRLALAIGAGHSFVVLLREGYPMNVLNAVKGVPEVCRIFCATANPLEVIVAETETGRGILGVVDGGKPLGVEKDEDVRSRKELLRRIGYKL